MEQLNSLQKTDCSGFIYSLFKSILNVDVGADSETIKDNGQNRHSDNGWTAELHSLGDESELKPGDILYRNNHVGLYVGSYGENNHVDQGGPDSGPHNRNYQGKATKYSHYIRYTKN